VLIAIGWQHGQSQVSAAQDQPTKLADWVIANTANGGEAEFLVILADQADLSPARTLGTKRQKGRFVRDTLLGKAQATQSPILDWLAQRRIEHRSFYIINAIWVKGTRDIADALAARADVARIEGNPKVRNNLTPQPTLEEIREAANQLAPEAIELGVNFIHAPDVWALGFTGQGIVIGGADTGIQWDHPALKNHYRGWDGATANHNFNWHDSIHSGGGSCGPNTTAPCDDDNHGTHTVGTALGDDGGANQIGVAPGAKFIGCRNMDQGNGQPSTYIECMEWFLAPYPIGGTPAQGDPAKAPDITTNSWGCPPSEGCSPASLQTAVEAQRAAGIMMVVAAGNSGSSCSTVTDPPSFYAASYTVGAFSASTGTIASFSSRGPATIDGSNRLKPDISAPGVSVRSAVRGGGYSSFSGTSMATPHTAGAVALLWSARPAYRHQIQQTIDLLNQAAVDVSSTACSSSGVPNNVYGWGRLDIKAAVDAAGGGCSYMIAPTAANFAAAGGSNTVGVTAGTGCAWTAVANAAWITVNSGSSGSGNGTVGYSVAANPGAQRSGTMTIAGQTFTVTQDANSCPAITVNPSILVNGLVSVAYSQTLTQTGGAGTITWSIIAGALPSGLSLNPGTGLLSGMPNATGVFSFTIQAMDANGCTGTRAYTVVISGAGLMFYPLPKPIRLVDTRAGQGNCDSVSTPIAGGTSLTTLARTTCESVTIPATAQAVVGNLTVLNQTVQSGYLTIYPDGVPVPLAANMIYEPGQSLSNNFTVGLSSDGKFNVFGERTIDVVVDISGYFAPPGAGGLFYHPLPKPIRLLDTRAGQGNCDSVSAPIAAGTSLTTQARTTCETLTIPTAAQAIVGNATVINGSGQTGYLTIYPNGVPVPLAANMVYTPGQILSNAFTVSLNASGEFNIFGERTINMVIDVAGYYSNEANDANGAGLLFTPLVRPLRILDTRPAQGNCDAISTPITGGTSIAAPGRLTCESITIPSTAQTVLGNVTVINLTPDAGYLTLYAEGLPQPLAANMVYSPSQTLSNAFVVGLNSGSGQFRIFAERMLDAVVDVSGYFAP
jgi:subtilisin family serine protease